VAERVQTASIASTMIRVRHSPSTYESSNHGGNYLYPVGYPNVEHGSDEQYDDYLDDYYMETRECMRYFDLLHLITYTAYLSSPFSVRSDLHHGLQFSQIYDEANDRSGDDGHWVGSKVDEQADAIEDSQNSMLLPTNVALNHRIHGTDFQSTCPTRLNSHPSIATQTYNVHALGTIDPSLGSSSRHIHGIRLRPVSDLRLS